MKNNAIIGKNIKAYREKLQLSQNQLANWLGVSRELISYYESGKREIDLKKLESIAELFGIELINLIEEDSDLISADLAFAFRSDYLTNADLEQISQFRRIIMNYLKMKHKLENENQRF